MRRIFIMEARKACTSNSFNIKDLPGTSGRLDIVCRCVIAALKFGGGVRLNTVFYAVLEGPPAPPLTLKVDGAEIDNISGSELQLALTLKKLLKGEKIKGFNVERKSFIEAVSEVRRKAEVYYLHESGKPIRMVNFPHRKDVLFVLGDHLGLPPRSERLLEKLGAFKVSLGPKRYLGSHCIVMVHDELDRKGGEVVEVK